MAKSMEKFLFISVIIIYFFLEYSTAIPFFNFNSQVLNLIRFLFYILIFIFSNFKIKKKQIKENIFLLVPAIIMIVFNWNFKLYIAVCLGLISKKFREKKVVKYFFYINLTFFLLVLYFDTLGILETKHFFRYIYNGKKWTQIMKRDSLGFSNPNITFIFFSSVFFSFLYLIFNKINFWIVILVSFIPYWVYTKTDSRTGILVNLVAILFIYCSRFINLEKFKILYRNIFIKSFIISSMAAIFFRNSKLNYIFSNRLTLWYGYLNKISIIGVNLKKVQFSGNQLDNGYIFSFFTMGVLGVFFINILINRSISNIILRKKIATFSIIVIYFLYNFQEAIIFNNGVFILPLILLVKNFNLPSKKKL